MVGCPHRLSGYRVSAIGVEPYWIPLLPQVGTPHAPPRNPHSLRAQRNTNCTRRGWCECDTWSRCYSCYYCLTNTSSVPDSPSADPYNTPKWKGSILDVTHHAANTLLYRLAPPRPFPLSLELFAFQSTLSPGSCFSGRMVKPTPPTSHHLILHSF